MFPAYEGQSRGTVTYALYKLTSKWIKLSNVSVKVIRILGFSDSKDKLVKFGWHRVSNIDVYNQLLIHIPRTKVVFFREITKKLLVRELLKKNFIPNIVIAHINDSFELAYLISKYFNAELVLGFHQSDIIWLDKSQNRKKIIKYLEEAKKIACRSKTIYERVSIIFPQYKDKMFIAYSGISEDIIENRDFFIEKSRFNEQEIVFSTVAKLIPLKNIDINLKALSNFKDKRWKYCIMGNGEHMSYLKKLANNLGIADKVIFTGYIEHDKVLEKLKETHVFIMVSAPETFGLAYLEAMAKANIVIGAKGWGIDGIVKNSFNGFLVKPRNVLELSEVLNKIFKMTRSEKEKILLNTWSTINKYTETEAAMNYLKNIFN